MTLPTTRSSARATERGAGGVTLLELLVVISILGVLLGLGVGVYGSLATPDVLAAERIRDALRAARLLAQREGAPAAVIVDPAGGDVYALGLHAAGNWHFEDDAGSGWPVPAARRCTSPRTASWSSPTCRRRPRAPTASAWSAGSGPRPSRAR
jgi:prepilin-type N-terminal cleavage/methylation domain-containing protein